VATTSVKMEGVDALVAKLESIKYDVKYKGGRSALRKAAQVIRNAARQNIQAHDDPETGRSIAKNITEKWNGRLFKASGDLGFRVGVQGGAKVLDKDNSDTGAGGPTPHWRFLEFGTEKNKAFPFLVPAMNANVQKAADVFIREYGRAIDRALKKAAKG
jgi:HK97 gp10 family phage protein